MFFESAPHIIFVYCQQANFRQSHDLEALSATKDELEKSISAWRPANWGLKITGWVTDKRKWSLKCLSEHLTWHK